MRLPELEHPERYQSLYVVDFGRTVAVGYTAEEVAVLLDSEAHRDVKVYRIHRASPDGTLELQGVPRQRFFLETGVFFYRSDLEAARGDYLAIFDLARRRPPPCRAQLFLGKLDEPSRLACVAGLAYPAEYDQDVSRWLLDNELAAGDRADGGVGRLEAVRRRTTVVESMQLQAAASRRSRSRQEILASTAQAVQRIA